MAAQAVLLPEAISDLAAARDWYDTRRAGLGDEFLTEVADCIARIEQNPERFERAYRGFRRALVRRFPYAIFFLTSDVALIVYGVFHCARESAKWQGRLS